MKSVAAEVVCAVRLTNGNSVRFAKVSSNMASMLQAVGSSRKLEDTVQCVSVDGGGRTSARAGIAILVSPARPNSPHPKYRIVTLLEHRTESSSLKLFSDFSRAADPSI